MMHPLRIRGRFLYSIGDLFQGGDITLNFSSARQSLNGEETLQVELLQQALSDLHQMSRTNSKLRPQDRVELLVDTWRWILDESESTFAPFGFTFACELVDLNPVAVREKIKRRYSWLLRMYLRIEEERGRTPPISGRGN
jgi:hypothetical protein